MSEDEIEKDRLALEREKFQFEQTKHGLTHRLDETKHALEEKKHLLEQEKQELEKTKAANEKRKNLWASLALIIPLITAAASIGYGAWSLKRSAEIAFATKAVELALSATSGPEAIGRARVIAALYPALLPEDYEKRLAQLPLGRYGSAQTIHKMELMKLLVQQPEHRAQIVADWGRLYPDWAWLSH